MKKILVIGAIFLSGCIALHPDQTLAVNACAEYGFILGTPEYANCQMQLDLNEKNRRAALAQQYLGAVQANLLRPIQSSPSFNCTSMPLGGGTVSTNCH